MTQPKVKLFVSAHKPFATFDSSLIQMVEVGAASRKEHFAGMVRDDQGINISDKNPRYCELTSQYWVWKNALADLDYVGFQHYRRFFNFSDNTYEENLFGEVMDDFIDQHHADRYGITDTQITAAIDGYDVVTAPFQDLRVNIHQYGNPIELYKAAPSLHLKDLRRVYDILCKTHPDFKTDADRFFDGHLSCFCNMFIMRKDLFADYCEWLFPILEEFDNQTDYTHYSVEALRTVGHLAERLFNIYFYHLQRTNPGLRTKELQVVHFTDPEVPTVQEPWDDVPEQAKHKIVPIVFAANNSYAPMVGVTLLSAITNSDPERYYDVSVLHSDIDARNQRTMYQMVAKYNHVNLRFVDIRRELSGIALSTNNEHISVETYYRFLIQKVLSFYDKVLYLDCDMIVKGDLADLYDTDLGDNLLGAVRDIDFLGQLNVKNRKRLNYAKTVLKMTDPYQYFQAGVLLLNTKQLRAEFSIDQWLRYAADDRFIYNDQDVLNSICQGRIVYLDPRWNVMHDCGGRVEKIFSLAPAEHYRAYLKAKQNPQIIHYAGFVKPWADGECDLGTDYWEVVRSSPYLGFFVSFLSQRSSKPLPHDLGYYKHQVRETADVLLPAGSQRRFRAKILFRRIRKHLERHNKQV